MRLVIGWMIVILLSSAVPDLAILHLNSWGTRPHSFFITHIDWRLVLSWNNPFFGIPNYLDPDTILHKIGHIFVYTVLGVLTYRAIPRIETAFWICTAYAFLDELHQAFTPGRSSRLCDVLLDALAAYVAIRLFARAKKKPVQSA